MFCWLLMATVSLQHFCCYFLLDSVFIVGDSAHAQFCWTEPYVLMSYEPTPAPIRWLKLSLHTSYISLLPPPASESSLLLGSSYIFQQANKTVNYYIIIYSQLWFCSFSVSRYIFQAFLYYLDVDFNYRIYSLFVKYSGLKLSNRLRY